MIFTILFLTFILWIYHIVIIKVLPHVVIIATSKIVKSHSNIKMNLHFSFLLIVIFIVMILLCFMKSSFIRQLPNFAVKLIYILD
jgi:hypothetical protein